MKITNTYIKYFSYSLVHSETVLYTGMIFKDYKTSYMKTVQNMEKNPTHNVT